MIRIPGAISPAKPLAIALALACSGQASAIVIPSCPGSYTVNSTPDTDTPETLTFDEAVALFSSECSAASDSAIITISDSLAGETLSETTTTVSLDNSRQLTIVGNADNPPVLVVESYSSPGMFYLGESSKLSLKNLKLIGSYAQNTESASESNAIRLFNSTLELDNVTARDFYVSGAGPVVDARYSTVTITDSVLDNNIASNEKGGAISTFDTVLTITDSVFTNNRANANAVSPNSGGGAIAANGGSSEYTNSKLTISGSEFSNNQAYGHGGALLIDSDNPATITDSVFESNTADSVFLGATYSQALGGAISMERVDATLSGNVFTNNQANGQGTGGDGLGGALYIGNTNFPEEQTGGEITVTDTTFQGNSAVAEVSVSRGGGLYLDSTESATLTVSRSTFSQNSAGDTGGALAQSGSSGHLTISNSTISGNSAGDAGAGLYFDAPETSYTRVEHSTIANNTLTAAGSGAAAGLHMNNGNGSNVRISHSVFTGNDGDKGNLCAVGEGYFELENSFVSDTATQTSCRDVTLLGDGNLVGSNDAPLDAKLGDLADNGGPTQTHYPQSDSPLINAGDLNIVDAPETDQRGSTRIESIIDMGSVEYANQSPSIIDTIADITLAVGTELSINAGAAFMDPESGDLTFSMDGAPAGISIDPDTGIISGTVTETGDFTVTLTATDSNGLSTDLDVQVKVTAAENNANKFVASSGGGGTLSLFMLALLGLLRKRR